MSDPTMHNRLYTAGWSACVDGRGRDPQSDMAVAEYSLGFPVGDQSVGDLWRVWCAGYDDARAVSATGAR